MVFSNPFVTFSRLSCYLDIKALASIIFLAAPEMDSGEEDLKLKKLQPLKYRIRKNSVEESIAHRYRL
jgi:hypothetical protein